MVLVKRQPRWNRLAMFSVKNACHYRPERVAGKHTVVAWWQKLPGSDTHGGRECFHHLWIFLSYWFTCISLQEPFLDLRIDSVALLSNLYLFCCTLCGFVLTLILHWPISYWFVNACMYYMSRWGVWAGALFEICHLFRDSVQMLEKYEI